MGIGADQLTIERETQQFQDRGWRLLWCPPHHSHSHCKTKQQHQNPIVQERRNIRNGLVFTQNVRIKTDENL